MPVMIGDPEYIIVETYDAFDEPDGLNAVRVHPREICAGRQIPCCIHNPSGHKMIYWPQRWSQALQQMERVCPHGQPHPDPDHVAYVKSLDGQFAFDHTCDGCCLP